MIQPPVDLTQNTTITELMKEIPADDARDELAEMSRRRTQQLAETLERTDAIASRLEAIAHALPDSGGKERDALQTERTELVVAQLSSAVDRRVAANNYASSVQAWASRVVGDSAAEMRAIREQLDPTAHQHQSLQRVLSGYAVGDPRFADTYERFQKIDAERKPLVARAERLKQLQEAIQNQLTKALGIPGTGHQAKVRNGQIIGDLTPTFVAHIVGEAA